MQHNDSSTGTTLLRGLVVPWRRYQLWRWQRQEVPRFLRREEQYPRFVRRCATTMDAIKWLRLLDWRVLPKDERHSCFGRQPVPLAAYVGAFLVKLDHQLPTVARLRRFLVAHPALVWALGFPLPAGTAGAGFDVEGAVPSARHLNRVLRELPNHHLQALLDAQVRQVQGFLPDEVIGETIALDTKHILAWVKENNHKQFIEEGRYDKHRQPKGDSDCKLGCKRRGNQRPVTPASEAQPASTLPSKAGEFYWGYASGAVVTRVAASHEFVLAELTQTFEKSEVSYFFPLLEQTERRLGRRPHFGALDAAFDAFYVYDYFHDPDHDGFAAVPFCNKGSATRRDFDPDGLPLCEAGLAMPAKLTYTDRTACLIPHRRTKHACPLLYPEPTGASCPLRHKKWAKGGCGTTLADTPGARIRHQLDRHSETYLRIYRQRSAAERIFSQALALGIERPKLRNQAAIANLNTLIYLLINVRTIARLQPALSGC